MDLPLTPMATRPLHFFWVVDTSSSMDVDGKMAQLDHAIRESLPEMKAVAGENPGAELLLRVLAFSSGARWITSDPVPVEEFTWSSLPPNGMTDLGEAFKLLASQLEIPPMPQRALPPVLLLVLSGMPTDDWRAGLAELDRSGWGRKAIRVAFSIGGDAQASVAAEFTGNQELVFSVTNSTALANAIRWVSTQAIKIASDSAVPAAETVSHTDRVRVDDGGHVWVRLTHAGLVRRVSEKIIPFVDEGERSRLEAIIADLEGGSDETLDEGRRRLGAAVQQHSRLL